MKQLKFCLPYFSAAGLILGFANIFFGFLSAGETNSLFGMEVTFFELAFQGSGSTPMALLIFLFNVLGVMASYLTFLFHRLKKRQWELSFVPASLACLCFLVCILLVSFLPLAEDLTSFGPALILYEIFLSLSFVCEGLCVLGHLGKKS